MSTALNDSSVLPAIDAFPDELAAPPRKVTRPTPGFWGALGWVIAWVFVCGFIPFFFAGMYAELTKQPLAPLVAPVALVGQVMGAALAIVLLARKHGWSWASEVGLNRL